MLISTIILLQFIFMFFSILLGIDKQNLLTNKGLIFIGTFIFQYMIGITTKIKNKTIENWMDIFGNAIFISLGAVLGYSIYVDAVIMKHPLIMPLLNNKITLALSISFCISLFVFLIYLVQMLIKKEEKKSIDII